MLIKFRRVLEEECEVDIPDGMDDGDIEQYADDNGEWELVDYTVEKKED